MGPDRLQLTRLELKYVIDEAKALAIRAYLQANATLTDLQLDEYGENKPNGSYPIHSLYLDSDDLQTYWATINGIKNRFKLRLRYYDQSPVSPVFFEVKRRMNEAILKQRGGVRREAVAWLLAGHLPEPAHLLSDDPRQLVALQRFSQLMLDLRGTPKAHVNYFREAWVSRLVNSVRITMDREVRCAREFGANLGTEMDNPVMPFKRKVILELKFTGRFPNWFRDLVQIFDLNRTCAAKYADGVEMIGEERFYGPGLTGQSQPAEPQPVAATARPSRCTSMIPGLETV